MVWEFVIDDLNSVSMYRPSRLISFKNLSYKWDKEVSELGDSNPHFWSVNL